MKKIKYALLATLLLCQWNNSFTQETVIDPNVEYKSLEKKLQKADEAINDPKKGIEASTWVKRGDVLQEVYNVDQKYLNLGIRADQIVIFYKNPDEQKEGEFAGEPVLVYKYERREIYIANNEVKGWKITQMATDEPLIKAYDSYNKAMELDAGGKTTSKLEDEIKNLKLNCEREASLAFTTKDYERSVKYFDLVIKLSESPAIKEKSIDSASYYNAGLAANNAAMHNEAVKYFTKAKEVKYGGSNLYFMLKRSYESLGDSANILKTLQDGFKAYPGDKIIIIELINYYLNKGQAKEALEYIAIAKKDDPSNASLLFAEGTLYDKMKDKENAINSYKAAIELKPDYFDPYYNLGVVYFNAAVEFYNIASTIPPKEAKKYEETVLSGNAELEKAVPFMEKAMEIAENGYNEDQYGETAKSTYKSTLETLKTIYFRLRNKEEIYQTKLKEVDEKLQTL